MGIRLDALNDLHAVLATVATAGSVTELPESVNKLIDISPLDFYQYACGAWYNDAVIPPDIHRIDTSFNKIGIQNEAVLTKIFSHNKTKLGKCGEFYNSCLDTATLSSLGLTPQEDWFKAIRVDDNDSTKNALFGFQAPLPLDSFYYTPSQWEYAEPMHKEVAAAVPVITRFEDTLANVDLNELQEIEAVVSPYTALTYYQMDQKYPLLLGSWLKTNGFNVRDEYSGSNDWVGFKDLTRPKEELLKNTTLDNLRTVMENKLIHASSKHLTLNSASTTGTSSARPSVAKRWNLHVKSSAYLRRATPSMNSWASTS
ncbi:hypothetical protein H257_17635 [Aphanomyces astaci]|uniref:Peptidase M13 N-terminal domain-containing protein n=1 Tax=Aphanomyces astaci TaxID=112090 RepID=W4FFQ0_APHAT|nr:hypothetical protein H257_17635 [Aphanomyces astaci]ETV65694.1 hypothetical protein H257_17635 [Aphanomyces astaci]|eukprot:XP_009844801.1 hypothetical protein H257_17635 [Aphanomyces astaci]